MDKIKSIFKDQQFNNIKITSITSYNNLKYGDDTYLLEEVCKRGSGKSFIGIVLPNERYVPKQLDLFTPENKLKDEYFTPSIVYQECYDSPYLLRLIDFRGEGFFTNSLIQSVKLFEWENYQYWFCSQLHKPKKVRVS